MGKIFTVSLESTFKNRFVEGKQKMFSFQIYNVFSP